MDLRDCLSDDSIPVDHPDGFARFGFASRSPVAFTLLLCGGLVFTLGAFVTCFVSCVPELPDAGYDGQDEQGQGDELGGEAHDSQISLSTLRRFTRPGSCLPPA